MTETITGAGTFYDGLTPAARPVGFRLDSAGLTLFDAAGRRIELWPRDDVTRIDAHGPVVRLAHRTGDARLEVTAPTLLPLLRAARIDIHGRSDARTRRKILGWSLAAAVSLVWLVVWGIPAIGSQVAALLPVSTEIRLGEVVRPQILKMLSPDRKGARVCETPAGRAALDALTRPILARITPVVPVKVEVIDFPVPNAFALPGGQVLITRGLLDKASGPNRVAAIFAHELGHVQNRDSLRRLGEAASLSFLFGVVIGDFSGSTLAIAVGRGLIDASYSRGAETRADAFAAEILRGDGRAPVELADALEEITRDQPDLGVLNWFSTHPDTEKRIAALRGLGTVAANKTPLIDDAAWLDLKRICKN